MKKLVFVLCLLAAVCLAQTKLSRMFSGVKTVTTSSYTFLAADGTYVLKFSGTTAASLPSGTTSGFGAGHVFTAYNAGGSSVTITCSSCTINGIATFSLAASTSVDFYSDGRNYLALSGGGGAAANALQKTGDTMAGVLTLFRDPQGAMEASTKQYADAAAAAVSTSLQTALTAGLAGKFDKSGGTFTGPVTGSRDPVNPLELATKGYVDAQVITPSANATQFNGRDIDTGAPSASYGFFWNVAQAKFVLGRANVDGIAIAPSKITAPAPSDDTDAATKKYVDDTDTARGSTTTTALAAKCSLAGCTMAGSLVLAADPTTANQAATKNYVDNQLLTPSANASQIQGHNVTTTNPTTQYQGFGWNVSTNTYDLIVIPQWPLTTTSANPAQSGQIRLGPTDVISARDTQSNVDVAMVQKGTAVSGGSRTRLGGVWGIETQGDAVVNGNLTVTGASSSVPTPGAGDASQKPANTLWVSQNAVSRIQLNGANQTAAGTLNFAGSYFTISYLAGVLSITPNIGSGGLAAYSDTRIVNAVQTSRLVAGANSISGGGALSGDLTLQLVNDSASPGATKCYGTDASGVKGWNVCGSGHTIFNAGASMTQRQGLNFVGATVTDDSGNNRTVVTVPTYTFNNRAASAGNFVPTTGDYSVSQITGAAADANVAHNTGTEVIAGDKTASGNWHFNNPFVIDGVWGYQGDCPTTSPSGASSKYTVGIDSNCNLVFGNDANVYRVPTTTGTATASKQLAFDANGRIVASAYDIGTAGGVNVNGSPCSNCNLNAASPSPDAGNIPATLKVSGSNAIVQIPIGTSSSTVTVGNDSRLNPASSSLGLTKNGLCALGYHADGAYNSDGTPECTADTGGTGDVWPVAAATPAFAPAAGSYGGTQSVTVTCSSGTVYCSNGSTLISCSGISVPSSATVWGRCEEAGKKPTVQTAAYTIGSSLPVYVNGNIVRVAAATSLTIPYTPVIAADHRVAVCAASTSTAALGSLTVEERDASHSNIQALSSGAINTTGSMATAVFYGTPQTNAAEYYLSWTGSQNLTGGVVEYSNASGVVATSTFKVDNTVGTTGSLTATASENNDILIGCIGRNTNSAITITAGSLRLDQHANSPTAYVLTNASTGATATTVSGTFTSSTWAATGLFIQPGTGTAQVATPSFSSETGSYVNDQTVHISTSTSGASLLYCTNAGSDCSPGTAFTTDVPISATGTHLCAKGTKSGLGDSNTHCATYTLAVDTITSNPAAPYSGVAVNPTLATNTVSTPVPYICYTTDGSSPTGTASSCTNGTHYTGAITVSSTTTIKAKGFKANYGDSAEYSGTFTIQAGISLLGTGKMDTCSNACTATITSYDTTGSTLLIAAVGGGGSQTGQLPTDTVGACSSPCNSWHALTQTAGSARIYYAYDKTGGGALVTGASHSVSFAGNTYTTLWVTAWSGTATDASVYDAAENGASGSAATLATGNVTPAHANDLLFTVIMSTSDAKPFSVDSNFTRLSSLDQTSSATVEGAVAYYIDPGTSAVQATWTKTAVACSTRIAVFKGQ